MGGLYLEYVIDYLQPEENVESSKRTHAEKPQQKANQLTASLKDLIKKLAKPKQ